MINIGAATGQKRAHEAIGECEEFEGLGEFPTAPPPPPSPIASYAWQEALPQPERYEAQEATGWQEGWWQEGLEAHNVELYQTPQALSPSAQMRQTHGHRQATYATPTHSPAKYAEQALWDHWGMS